LDTRQTHKPELLPHLYADKPNPIIFLPVAVSTSGRVYDAFVRLIFLHTHREASILTGESPEESDQFRFFRATHLTQLKGSVGLILAKASNEGYYSHRFIYAVFHTSTSYL
jgi:hypothetical protein